MKRFLVTIKGSKEVIEETISIWKNSGIEVMSEEDYKERLEEETGQSLFGNNKTSKVLCQMSLKKKTTSGTYIP